MLKTYCSQVSVSCRCYQNWGTLTSKYLPLLLATITCLYFWVRFVQNWGLLAFTFGYSLFRIGCYLPLILATDREYHTSIYSGNQLALQEDRTQTFFSTTTWVMMDANKQIVEYVCPTPPQPAIFPVQWPGEYLFTCNCSFSLSLKMSHSTTINQIFVAVGNTSPAISRLVNFLLSSVGLHQLLGTGRALVSAAGTWRLCLSARPSSASQSLWTSMSK